MPSAPEKKPNVSPLLKWHNEIMRHLISKLQPVIENKKVTPAILSKVIDVIIVDLSRSPWPASLLSKEKKENWKLFVLKNAKLFLYSNGASALREFASKISSQLLRELTAAQLTESLLDHNVVRNTKIEHMIRQEFHANASSDDMVSRSVQRYFREDYRSRRMQTEIKTTDNDPLIDLLGLPHIGRKLLPHEDIRVHMARFLNARGLSGRPTVQADNLNETLGKIFTDNCKPIGFADQQKTILIVEVRSSLAAQELGLNKPIYLAKLKQMPGFESLLDIQFRVKPSKSK